MTVGILGGGQLGRMLALAGIPWDQRFRVLEPSPQAATKVPRCCSSSSTQSTQRIHYFIHADVHQGFVRVRPPFICCHCTFPAQHNSQSPERSVARRIGRTKDRNNRCAERIGKMQRSRISGNDCSCVF